MEEILASIRRIIADDQKEPEPPPPAASAKPAPVKEVPKPEPVAVAPPPEPDFEEDDVLDLAGVAEPVRKASLDLDMPEIGFRDDEPIDFDAIEIDPEPEPEPVKAAAPPPQPAPPPPPPPQPAPAAPAAESRLLSRESDASVSQAFTLLANTVLSNNARTLEDLVQEMLRPMLKAWLDDNLPVMVERLVRAEIERVARGR